MHERGLLRRIYTQNIDGLEALAGLPAERVVQCHGGFGRAHCADCDAEADAAAVRAAILAGRAPRCAACGDGPCKPRITFFGEKLPARFQACREEDFYREDDGRAPETVAAHDALKKAARTLATRASFGLVEPGALEAANAAVEAAEAERLSKLRVSCACDLLLVFGTSLKVRAPAVGGAPAVS